MNRLGRMIAILGLAVSVGCAPAERPATRAASVAEAFARVCVQPALQGLSLSQAFGAGTGFVRSDRPSPGPRAVPFDGPEAMTGIRQRFPNSEPPQSSCAIYATVSNETAIHAATDAVLPVSAAVQTGTFADGRAVERILEMERGFSVRVISSRLRSSRSALNPVPGNVQVIVFADDL